MLNFLGWPTRLPYQIDWEAWATLITGLAAVAAAYAIGRQQVGIAKRQTDIADRQSSIFERQATIQDWQSRIEASKHRAELFDRRIAVVEAMSAAVDQCQDVNSDGTAIRSLSPMLYRSYHLFSDEVGSALLLFGQKMYMQWMNGTVLKIALDKNSKIVLNRHEFEDFVAQGREIYSEYSKILGMVAPFLKIEEAALSEIARVGAPGSLGHSL